MIASCKKQMGPMPEPPTISEIMYKAISDRVFPGGAVAFGSCTVPCYYRECDLRNILNYLVDWHSRTPSLLREAYGTYTFESSIRITPESLWDMASLTKIMVTTPSVMILFERGKIELEELACKYLPEFGSNGKELVTIHQLLTHTAGLREFYPFFDMGLRDSEQVLDYIMNDKLWYTAGEVARYSDLSMIVLGLIVERISGVSLDVFAAEELLKPLGMRHTMFRPTAVSDFDLRVVPTEIDHIHRKCLLWGEVHDPTAFLLGGVAGHAGLFSTIIDVCRMMLAGGLDVPTNRRLFKESTVRLFVTPDQQTATNTRPFALGWDVALRRSVDGYTSAGKYLGPATFGHTGFTGTSLWIDPDRDLFVALLTNAVHPTAVGGCGSKVREVRPLIADAAVHTMEEQAIPRRSLRWQFNTYDGGNRYQGLAKTAVRNYSTSQQGTRDGQHATSTITGPSQARELEQQFADKDLQLLSSEAIDYRESPGDSSKNTVASESFVSYEGSLDICEGQRERSRTAVLVPAVLIALIVSMIC